jgi:predicted nucleic acid-binding protein
MFDTNVLISVILNGQSVPGAAWQKASDPPYTLVLCAQILDELRNVFNRKFPHRIPGMERFLSRGRYGIVTLADDDTVGADEGKVRDVTDRPILRAARKAGVDILVTGDRDFLDSTVTTPRIMTPSQFLQTD